MEFKKKIAVLCNYVLLPNRVGGMDRFFWMFDKTCKEKGFEVIWFFPNDGNHQGYPQLKIISANSKTIENVFLDYVNENSISFDYIITHFLEICTPFSKKIKNIFPYSKLIVIDHNPRPLEGYPFKKRIEKKIKGLLFYKYIDLFVGVSEYTKNQLIKDFGNFIKSKTKVIYNGIDFKPYKIRSERNHEKPTFLVACHLRESKGIQDLIEAVYLLENKKNLVIDIYGDGPYKEQLVNKIKVYNLESNFNFKGSVANLYEIYCQYDYLLQPTHMECFSLTILESLYSNVPLITTNVGGNEEVVTHAENGFIFDAKNVIQLKSIIENVLNGTNVITINTSIFISDNFSIEKMVQEHFKLIFQ